VRAILRKDGSGKVNKAADELEELILYVARSFTDNLEANYALVESDRAAARIPLAFANPALNSRLGLDASEGDKSAERVLPALRQAIAGFANVARVDKEFARQVEASRKSGGAKDSPPGGWPDVREELLTSYLQFNVLRKDQRRVVEKLATEAKAPSGFENTKWHMSLAEVRTARPNAKVGEDGYLEERSEWLGRPVIVNYSFGTLGLLQVIVTYSDYASLESYEKTRAALETAHGTMPPASKDNEFELVSKYRKSLFSIVHGLRPSNTEQVVFGLKML
jgi:hypothetical protein